MKILQLRTINPELEDIIINIDRSTHIGRTKSTSSLTPGDYHETTGRPLPADFYEAEICFQLDSPTISRNHALIRRYSNLGGLLTGYEIVDLNSLNGIKIDGKRVQKSTLKPSAALKIGDIEFKVSYTESSGNNYALLVGNDKGN